MDRRKFLTAAAGSSLALALPRFAFAQSDEKPNFDVAGTHTTNPPGYEIAWSDIWEEKDITNLTFENIPGQLEYLVLDWTEAPSGLDHQRIVITANAESGLVDPEELLASFPDSHPETMGYAPGTTIVGRGASEDGCWFSIAGGENPFETGVIGLSLYYVPKRAGDALLNVDFNIHSGTNRTPEHLEMIDSTISINGNWLLALDDLGSYWDAFEESTESTL